MSQRLITKQRRPIGVTSKGVAVFAISGAEEDPEEDNESDEGGADGSEGQNTGKESESGEDDKPAGKTYTAEEYAALERRMQAADRNKSEAEKRLKEIEDAKKDDLTKATEKVTDLEKSVKEKDEVIANLRFENSFALNNSIVWHDPALALAQVRQRPEVTVEEDGTIKGLDAAIKALAKDKPYLVKKDTSEEKPPKSGSATGSGKKTTSEKLDPKRLMNKYKI